MQNMRQLRNIAFAAVAAVAITSCSDDDPVEDNNPDDPGTENVDPDAPVKGTMTEARVSGFVTDTDGHALANVTVVSGTHSAVTNEAGAFTFSKVDVNDGRSLIEFSKDGYFKVTRAAAFSDDAAWNIVMVRKGKSAITTQSTFTAGENHLIAASNMKVDFGKGGMKNRLTGQNYSGNVTADMLYLNPNDEHFAEMMPGSDLSAVRTDGSAATLVSYGMTSVNLTGENGEELQLAEGSPATVTFPIPEGMEENSPETIPLWSFDESTGKWVEEGEAHLTDGVYVGTVTHFSWVNLDWPEEQATVDITVKDTEGLPVQFQRVKIGQISGRTDAKGHLHHEVPARTAFKVYVKSEWYGDYSPEVSVDVAPLAPRENKTIELVLPHLYKLTGRVLQDKKPATAYLWLTYNSNDSERTVTNADGTFEIQLPTQYTGAAILNVLSGQKLSLDINVEGKDIDMGDIEINSTPTQPGEDKLLTPAESKQYLEAVATDFLKLFKPEDQREAIELANHFVNTYGDLEAPAEWELDETDEGYNMPRRIMTGLYRTVVRRDLTALSRAFDNVYDFKRFAGIYEPGNGIWRKTGNSNDIVFKFTDGSGSACTVTATGTGSEWEITSDGNTIRTPENVVAKVVKGSTTIAQATVRSNYSEKNHTASTAINAVVANIEATSALNANDNRVTANAEVKVSGSVVLTSTAAIDGKNLCNFDYIRNLLDNEDGDGLNELLTKASAEVNLLSRLQAKGEISDIQSIVEAIDGCYDSYEYDSKEEGRKLCEADCRVLNSKIMSGIYYSSATMQAQVYFQPDLYEETEWGDYWEWIAMPVLRFPSDGSTYSFEDYFGNSRFASVENLWENLIDSYRNLWK